MAPPAVIDVRPSDDPARDVGRARAIAAGLAARSVQRLGELIENADGRVSLAACESVRKWLEEPRGSGGKDGSNMPSKPDARDVTPEGKDAERAHTIRAAVVKAMPSAPAYKVATQVAHRFREAGLDPMEHITVEELEAIAQTPEK